MFGFQIMPNYSGYWVVREPIRQVIGYCLYSPETIKLNANLRSIYGKEAGYFHGKEAGENG